MTMQRSKGFSSKVPLKEWTLHYCAGNVLASHFHQHFIAFNQQFRYGTIVGHNEENVLRSLPPI
jgi:hypothetical protein